MLMELSIVTLGWTFDPLYHVFILQVIWAIGVSMIILGLTDMASPERHPALRFVDHWFSQLAGYAGKQLRMDRLVFCGIWRIMEIYRIFICGHIISSLSFMRFYPGQGS